MKRLIYFRILMVFVLLLTACKSKPAVPEAETAPSLSSYSSPSATLSFTGIQADDIEHLKVSGILETKAPSGNRARIESWRVEIDGQDASFAFGLNYPQNDFAVGYPVSLTLSMDIAALIAKDLAPKDDYAITLITELDVLSGSALPVRVVASETASFPGLREPTFSITSIAILKAELINTRFRVNMKIDNPNPFPLELSNFVYELYGNGRLWAEAAEKKGLMVEGRSSMQSDLFLIMNFINMERGLLNQIINLVDVNYHFIGKTQVSTGIDYLPKFNTGFDLSGYSKVLEK
jgi:LEA14-like dessication related protein